jgi:glycogen phosphorylase
MSSTAYSSRTSETDISEALRDLALDLRWSFNHSADRLWERLDPELWDLTHNPWVVLQTVSRERLESVTSDPNFQKLLISLHREKTVAVQQDAWFQKAHPYSGVSAVAYFSMEFLLS